MAGMHACYITDTEHADRQQFATHKFGDTIQDLTQSYATVHFRRGFLAQQSLLPFILSPVLHLELKIMLLLLTQKPTI